MHLPYHIRVKIVYVGSDPGGINVADSRSNALAAAVGAAGGLAVGLFLASRQGRRLRAILRRNIRLGTSQIEERLHTVEDQLRQLEHSVVESRRHFLERVKAGGDEDDSPQWDVSGGDVIRELPHLPRR